MSRRSLIEDTKYINTTRNNISLNDIGEINNSGDLYFNIVSGSATGSNEQLAIIPGTIDGNASFFLELDTGKYLCVNGYPARSNPGFVYCQGVSFDGTTYTKSSTKALETSATLKTQFGGAGAIGSIRLTKDKSLVIVNKHTYGQSFDCHVVSYTGGTNLPTILNTSTLTPPLPSYYPLPIFGTGKMDLINLNSQDDENQYIVMFGKGTNSRIQISIFIVNINTNETFYVTDDLAHSGTVSDIMLVELGVVNNKSKFAALYIVNGGPNSLGDINYTLYSFDRDTGTLTKENSGNRLVTGDFAIQNSPNLFLKNGYNIIGAKERLSTFVSRYMSYLIKYENSDISVVASSSISETNTNILVGGGPAFLGGISKTAPLYNNISNSELDTLNKDEIIYSTFKEVLGGYRLSNLDINYTTNTINTITTGSDSLLLYENSDIVLEYGSIGSLFMYNAQTGSFFYLPPGNSPTPSVKPFFIDKS